MKKSFTVGAVAGISAVALAVPFLVQISSAQSSAPAKTDTAVTQTAASDASSTQTAPTVAQATAEATALAAHPGKLSAATKLESHFGGYKTEVTGNDGKEYDVIVDPTTGQITDSWVDGQGGPKGGHMRQHDASQASEAPGTENPLN